MPEPVTLKVTSAKENGSYTVKDNLGRNICNISVGEEGHNVIYNSKGVIISELIVE